MALKRVRGGWRVDYRDREGRRYRKTFRLQKKAKEHLDETLADIRKGTFIPPVTIPTLDELSKDWLTSKEHLRPASVVYYQAHLDEHILPSLGEKRLSEIDVASVEQFRNARRAFGLASQTVNKLLATLSQLFIYAQRRQLCAGNPAVLVERLKRDTAELTEDDDGKANRTGVAVSPEDVPSHDEERSILRAAEPGFYLVFATAQGTPMHRGNVLRVGLHPACDRAQVRHFTMHAFRHYCASTLLADGRSLPEVQAILEHSSPAVTMGVYAKWLRGTESTALETLAGKLCGGDWTLSGHFEGSAGTPKSTSKRVTTRKS